MSFAAAGIADPFDALMVSTCQILMKTPYTPGAGDQYGIPSQAFITLVASWPCRKSTKNSGKDYKKGKEFATNEFIFFMRPPALSSPAPSTNLTTNYWLRLNTDLDPGDPNYDESLFNITAVDDPSGIGHHLEVKTLQVIP